MILDNIERLKSSISIHANKKTSNILDGSYRSIYKGNGLNFEDLREYIPGDNVRDIDWKASSRSKGYLVKRYISEKKHNIMLIFDTGKKLLGDTAAGESKHDVALMVGGIIGLLAAQNGDFVGSIFGKGNMIDHYQTKAGLYNLERILTAYTSEDVCKEGASLKRTLEYVISHIRRRMIVFIISDAVGISSVDEGMYKRLACQHDVCVVNISDIELTGKKSYSVENDCYVPEFITKSKKLKKLETQIREETYNNNERILIRYGIAQVTINSKDEVAEKVIELLEKHKR